MTRDLQRAVDEALRRLGTTWPNLTRRPDAQAEIRLAVTRIVDEQRMEMVPTDLSAGIDLLLETRPSSDYRPGPADVRGCVLTARQRRLDAEHEGLDRRWDPQDTDDHPRAVVGRQCTVAGCHGGLELHPGIDVLRCASCGSVQCVEEAIDGRKHLRIRLHADEVERLTLYEETGPKPTMEEAIAGVRAVLAKHSGKSFRLDDAIADEPGGQPGWGLGQAVAAATRQEPEAKEREVVGA